MTSKGSNMARAGLLLTISASLCSVVLADDVTGIPRLGADHCVDNEPALVAAMPSLVSCANMKAIAGGACTAKSAESQALIMAGIATEPQIVGLMQLCRKTCGFCVPLGQCADNDVAAQAQVPAVSFTCATFVRDDGGNCDLAGPVSGLARSSGVTEAQLAGIVEACPASCGRCTPDPCTDGDESVLASRNLENCAALRALGEDTCSFESSVIQGGISSGIITQPELAYLYENTCKATCGRCRKQGFCHDDDYRVTNIVGQRMACRQVMALVGGVCDRTALIAGGAQFGISAMQIDLIIEACPRSCGICTPAVPNCRDDDAAAAAIGIPDVANCRGPVSANFGMCTKHSIGSMGSWTEAQHAAFAAACPFSCATCQEPDRCRDYDAVLDTLKPGTSCAAVIDANGGNCMANGPALSVASPIETVALNAFCPYSCGHCWRREPEVCADDNAGVRMVLQLYFDCTAVVRANGGLCWYGPALDNLFESDNIPYQASLDALAALCPASCGFCEASVTPVPTMAIPEAVYFVHRVEEFSSEGGFAGGKYELDDFTCNGEAVWTLNQTQGLPGSEIQDSATGVFHLLSENGTWVAIRDTNVEMTLNTSVDADVPEYTCELKAEPIVKGSEPHELNNPLQQKAWLNKELSTSGSPSYVRKKLTKSWVVDTHSRFEAQTCGQEALCLQLNCMEPLDGYVCGDCVIEHAVLRCGGDSGSTRRIMVVVVVLMIVFLIIFNVGCCTNDDAEETAQGKERTAVWQKQIEHLTNPLEALFHRYRGFFINGLGQVGNAVSQNRVWFFLTMVLIDVMFMSVGLPVLEVNTSKSQWVPAGSRISKEVELRDMWEEDVKQYHQILVMVGPTNGSDAANAWTSDVLVSALKDMVAVETDIFYPNGTIGMRVKGKDFCQSLDNPALDGVLKGAPLPCIAPASVDCFFEGAWEFENVTLGRPQPPELQSAAYANLSTLFDVAKAVNPGSITHYKDRPSYWQFLDPDAYKAHVSDQSNCQHWVTSASLGRVAWGGATWEEYDGPQGTTRYLLKSAKKQTAVVTQYPPKRTAEFKKWMRPYGERGIEDALDRWLEVVLERMEEMDKEDTGKYKDYDITLYMSSSIAQMQKRIGSGQFGNMVIGFALMCVLMIVAQFSWTSPHKNHVVVGLVGMVMVLLANLSGVGFIVLCGINFNHTMIQALPFLALGLGVDDLFLMLHYYNAIENKLRPNNQVISELYRMSGTSVTLTSLCNSLAFFSGMVIPIPALQDFLASAGILVIFNYLTMFLAFPALLSFEADRNRKYLEGKEGALGEAQPLAGSGKIHSVQSAVIYGWSPFLQKPAVRMGVTAVNLFFFLLMVISLASIAPLKLDFDLTDLTPKGSYLSKGFRDVDRYVDGQQLTHDMMFYNVDLPHEQRDFGVLFEAARNNSWSLGDTGVSTKSWLFWYLNFCNNIGVMEAWEYADKGEETPKLAINSDYIGRYFVNETIYYHYMQQFRNPANGLTTIPAQLLDGFGWKYGVDSYHESNIIVMGTYSYQVNAALLDTPDDWMEHTNDLHDLYDGLVGKGRAFPSPSGMYLVMEQFSSLTRYFWTAYFLGITMIFVASMLIPISIRGAAVIAVTSAIATIEVAALLMLFGLSFSSLIAVALLVGMGITVEFSAHVVAGYEYAEGTRTERMHKAIIKTFVPVCEGGFSSFLSFVLLAFSEFPYVFKYFFVVFLTVIGIGILHGVIFLPCLVGLVGSASPQAPQEKPMSAEGRQANQIVIVPAGQETSPNPLVASSKNTVPQKEMTTNNGF